MGGRGQGTKNGSCRHPWQTFQKWRVCRNFPAKSMHVETSGNGKGQCRTKFFKPASTHQTKPALNTSETMKIFDFICFCRSKLRSANPRKVCRSQGCANPGNVCWPSQSYFRRANFFWLLFSSKLVCRPHGCTNPGNVCRPFQNSFWLNKVLRLLFSSELPNSFRKGNLILDRKTSSN